MSQVSDVTKIPYRWVCRIDVQVQGAHSVASGVLVSPWHVLTAAHVISPREDPDSWRTIEVGPGFRPGSNVIIKSNGWAFNPRWNVRDCMTDGSDLAVIRLAKPVGRDIGFWNIVSFNPADLAGKTCLMAGYPCRLKSGRGACPPRPDARDVDLTQMFQSEGQITGSIVINQCTPDNATGRLLPSITPSTLLIAHNADSEHSMSGGPICVIDRGAPKLVAIHTGTVAGGAIKKAVLLSDSIQTQIQNWINRALRAL